MSKFPLSFDEFKSPDITIWKLTRSEIEHENNLINHRLTWLNASQGFFFTMFGLVYSAAAKGDLGNQKYQAPFLLGTIAMLALYFCLSIRSALRDAEIQLDILTQDYNRIREDEKFPERLPSLHNRKGRSTKRYLVFEHLPAAFLCAWAFLLVAIVFDLLGVLKDPLEKHGMFFLIALLAVIFVVVATVVATTRYIRRRYTVTPRENDHENA
jgi:hypothetical protein